MEGSFKIGEQGWYEVANAVENQFLNDKLESDQYGIYYSVRFQGDAETYLWQSKTAPEEKKKYWGHIEESKSGKSMRFKRDKEPEDTERPSGAVEKKEWQGKNDFQITLNMVWKNMLQYFDVKSLLTNVNEASIFWEAVTSHTNELLALGENIQTDSKKAAVVPPASPEDVA